MRISDWSSDVCSSDLPGSDRRQSRDPAFTNTVEARTVLDWSAVNGTGVSTAILPEAQNGLCDFTVSMGNGGPLLQQLQMLPAGDYVLEGHRDRKGGVSGKGGCVRVDFGGRRRIKKNKKNNK